METIAKFTTDIAYISKLGNSPNINDGLSASELKARFDQAGQDTQEFINELVTTTNNNFSELSQTVSENQTNLLTQISDLKVVINFAKAAITTTELDEILT